MASEKQYWDILNRIKKEESEENAGGSNSDATTEDGQNVSAKEEYRQPA